MLTNDILGFSWGRRVWKLAVWERAGAGPGLLYFPGLGGAKEDFLAAAAEPALAGRRCAALDWPGHGESAYPDGANLTLDDCAGLAALAAAALDLERPLVVGHGMGGVIGLLYAERYPLSGFASIEGSLLPENCRFSRESKDHDFNTFRATILPARLAALRVAQNPAGLVQAAALAAAEPRAVYNLEKSLVDLCDGGTLPARYRALPCLTRYIYGSENAGLAYLPALRAAGGATAEIPDSGHFPQRDNPAALARLLADFSATL